MASEKITNSFSRIMNGNFSHGLAYWSAERLVGHHHRDSELRTEDRTSDFSIPSSKLQDTSPSLSDGPTYWGSFGGEIRHHIQYNDLATFPSVAKVYLGDCDDPVADRLDITPCGFGTYLIRAASPSSAPVPVDYLEPFGMADISDKLIAKMNSGDAIIINDKETERSGQYRAGEVFSPTLMVIGTFEQATSAFTNADVDGAHYNKPDYSPAPTPEHLLKVFYVRLLGDLLTMTRHDNGEVGLTGNDFFVSQFPTGSGHIIGRSFDGTYTNLVVKSEESYFVPPTSTPWVILHDWFIEPRFEAAATRQLPVILYELTLAYSLRSGYSVDTDEVYLDFHDEFDNVVDSIQCSNVEVTAFERHSRVTCRFRSQRAESHVGPMSLRFTQPSGSDTLISNVGLWKGDYTDSMTTLASINLLNDTIAEESGIVPRGAVVAYVGGSMCPPGFVSYEGISRPNDRRRSEQLGPGTALSSKYFKMSDTSILSVALSSSDTGSRTILHLGEEAYRKFDTGSGNAQYAYQKVGGYYPVTPYTGNGPTSSHRQWDPRKFFEWRAWIGNPKDVWVQDTGAVSMDIFPGSILEMRFADRSVYAIISQAFQGDLVTEVYELLPRYGYPEYKRAHDDAYHYSDQDYAYVVAHVGDRNAYWSHEQFYGHSPTWDQYSTLSNIFELTRERSAKLELIGDFSDIIARGIDEGITTYVWKSGVVAHAERVEDMRDGPHSGYYSVKGLGGFGYTGAPHSHHMQESADATMLDNITSNSADTAGFVPSHHEHEYVFGAVTLPKVRPVLLCQKL